MLKIIVSNNHEITNNGHERHTENEYFILLNLYAIMPVEIYIFLNQG